MRIDIKRLAIALAPVSTSRAGGEPMGTYLTAAQVAALVKKAGFPASEHVTAVAVCKAESHFLVEARNLNSSARGLFQILASVHRRYDERLLVSDPQYNTNAAYNIWKANGSWRPWSAFNSGAYTKFLAEARQGVAQASAVNGSPVLPGGGKAPAPSTGSGGNPSTAKPALTYGPPGPQLTGAGIGTPQDGTSQTAAPLSPLKIFGSEMWGDYSKVIIGAPAYEAGIETVPNIKFTVLDPEGELLFKHRNVFVKGARVQYSDLDFRIDQINFEPGGHGTGQITVTAIDSIAYALMNLTGPASAGGISAVEWLSQELRRVGFDPAKYLLGESVVTQSEIIRDVADQEGSSGQGAAPSAWTTMVRLARELGKRFFISGNRVVFGSSAFAMRWCAPGSLRLTRHGDLPAGEKWQTMPSAKQTSVGNRSGVLEVTGRVPLNRALYFRPGVSAIVRNTPAVAGDSWLELMVTKVSFALGTDVDGAEVTMLLPVDPPAQPPNSPSPNSGPTSAGTTVSGGGADGQVDKFVALALAQAGDRYVFGGEASPSDPDPKVFDCSELVEWAAARAGISPRVPDGSAAQIAHCRAKGTLLSVAQAINTKGALLYQPGHIAISLGNGKTIEAMNPSAGVRQGNAAGRGWTQGGKIPGAQGYR